MKSLTKIVLALLLTLWLVPVRAQSYLGQLALSDSARASLVTCGPGNDFYTTFGHTAIRVTDPAIHLDLVYNYGTFDFNTPHFYLTFARGKLDYCLSRTDYRYFMAEYAYEGRWVRQQTLLLSHDEVQRLFRALEENYLEANRYYRYDLIKDNCATRARDMIEQCLDPDKPAVATANTEPDRTYRQLLCSYTGRELMWWQFGVDLLLGQRCDKATDMRERAFLPCELMEQAALTCRRGTTIQPLAAPQELLLGETRTPPNPSVDPSLVFWLFLAAVAALTAWQLRRGFSLNGLDMALFGTASLIAVVLVFMWLCTDHYCTKANWNLLWANPLFIYLLIRWRHPSRWVTLALMVMLLVAAGGFALLPQQYNPAVLPIIITLFIRTTARYKLKNHRI